ncbi:LuxR C-terminal-related transcriptional regulator [Nonomuraea sp. NPDC005983]|uniref:ATP-binding protein n=1 Tax=Nonomuraea sp. NPDC005983 TaxID=3155595 RepID=UPI0033BBDDC9
MSVLVAGSTRKRKGNLPAELNSFVGRRHEITKVKQLLSESRLVTLTGPGGVGKTRLALRVADQVRRAFPDGVWLVGLADLSDAELLLATVAHGMGVQDYSTQGLSAPLLEFLHSKDLLLVLDNCEHLVDACAEFIRAVLPTTPRMRILATSRQSLGIVGEHAWAVPTLDVPDLPAGSDSQVPQMLAQSGAVSLFADRVRAAVPSFELTPVNAGVVVEICRRLEGIPLALELAAVRMRSLSAEQILARLDNRFQLLIKGNRAGEARQQTLQALFDWSYEHCTLSERTLWERLSVFAGGFDLAAAEQVCVGEGIAATDVLDLVDALVDKSILSVVDDGGAVRYRMLETIRQYAQDRLTASGEWAVVRRRHRDYFQTMAEACHRQWFGPDQVAWFAWFRREHANLQAALRFCLTEPGQAQVAQVMVGDMWVFFLSGHVSEGRQWCEQALALAPEPTPARAAALRTNAWMAIMQADIPTARRLLRECHRLAEALGEQSCLATADAISGWAALTDGDPASGVVLLEQALATHLALGDIRESAFDQKMLQLAVFLSGDVERSAALSEKFLELCESQGELWLKSWALFQYSLAVGQQGDHRRAGSMVQECLRIKVDFDDRLGVGHCLEHLAWITAVDNPGRSACLLGAAQGVLQTMGASLFSYLRTDHDRCVAALHASLGEKRFTAMFERGAALTLDEAVAEAKGERAKTASPASEAGHPDLTALTPREKEVAALVAEGLTNREIAARLVISQRTAEGHVEHIMTKLGLTSRAQIAALVAQATKAP